MPIILSRDPSHGRTTTAGARLSSQDERKALKAVSEADATVWYGLRIQGTIPSPWYACKSFALELSATGLNGLTVSWIVDAEMIVDSERFKMDLIGGTFATTLYKLGTCMLILDTSPGLERTLNGASPH